ncbi:MAG: L-serine ammonia-lyase, iron-sulfur-dependent, subunit alpha [Lawsonibacter sp.]
MRRRRLITYLCGGDYEKIGHTIVNTLVNVGGIVCDGAKPSCATKITSSVDATIMAHEMSMRGYVFNCGDGLVQKDIESTIKAFGYVGRVGMRQTDDEILKIMTENVICKSGKLYYSDFIYKQGLNQS